MTPDRSKKLVAEAELARLCALGFRVLGVSGF
jgi:hypothetical protein